MKLSIEKLLSITEDGQVEELIQELIKKNIIGVRAVGDNDCNCGIININKNPISGSIERVINMQDSFLEKLAYINKEVLTDKDKSDPRKLIEKIYDYKDGRLENLQDLKKKREIGKNMIISYRDSGNEKKPTVDYRDFGIGQYPEEMPNTILSLNKSSKVKLHYTIGSFGQGGSTAYPSSNYTLILSKRFTLDGNNKRTAFTIVRYNSRKGKGYKMGVYEYLVDKKTNLPIEIETTEDEFEAGTLIRHITMDVGKYTQMVTQPSGNSLWTLLNLNMFDSILPMWIEDGREAMIKSKNKNSENKNNTKIGRTLSGNFTRLENKDDEENKTEEEKKTDILYKHSVELEFCNEIIKISYWVANFQNKRNYMDQYVYAGHPIIITLNGQKHGELPNGIIKNDAKLPYLVGEMAIHINCDKISYDLRREMFSSTRENIKENYFYDKLRELLSEVLQNDDTLKNLNQLKRISLSKGGNSSTLEEIGNRVSSKLKNALGKYVDDGVGNDIGEGGRPSSSKPNGVTTVYPPIPVKDPPTFIKITSFKEKFFQRGNRIWIKFTTDADGKYFDIDQGKFNISISDKENFILINKTIQVKNGRGSIGIATRKEAPILTKARITLTLEVSGKPLSDWAEITLKDIEKPNIKKINMPKHIKIIPVVSNSEYWVEKDWNTQTVGDIVTCDDSVDLYISMDNSNLTNMLKAFKKGGEEIKSKLENTYIENLVYSLLFYELKTKEINGEIEANCKAYRNAAYEMTCMSICSFISDNKNLYEI